MWNSQKRVMDTFFDNNLLLNMKWAIMFIITTFYKTKHFVEMIHKNLKSQQRNHAEEVLNNDGL